MPPFFIYYHLYNNACHDQYQTQNRKHGNLFSQNKMCQNQRHKRSQICQIGNHRCISQIHLFFQDPAEKRMISAGQSSFITNAVCALRRAVPKHKTEVPAYRYSFFISITSSYFVIITEKAAWRLPSLTFFNKKLCSVLSMISSCKALSRFLK